MERLQIVDSTPTKIAKGIFVVTDRQGVVRASAKIYLTETKSALQHRHELHEMFIREYDIKNHYFFTNWLPEKQASNSIVTHVKGKSLPT